MLEFLRLLSCSVANSASDESMVFPPRALCFPAMTSCLAKASGTPLSVTVLTSADLAVLEKSSSVCAVIGGLPPEVTNSEPHSEKRDSLV